jgi:hypothetical protein
MRCLSIRKQKFLSLINKFPPLRIQIRNKFFSHYSQEIYQPMMRKKKILIAQFNERDDYNQVLYLHELNRNGKNIIQQCIKQNLMDLKKQSLEKSQKN